MCFGLWKLSSAKDLKCTYEDHPWGKACKLYSREPIRAGKEDNGYTFTGLTQDQKRAVTVITFCTSEIDFVPKEAKKEFPNLKALDFAKTSLTVLTENYMNRILKFVYPKITSISFHQCRINQIDPKLVSTLAFMEQVDLNGNNCVSFYKNSLTSYSKLSDALNECTDNFVKHYEPPTTETIVTVNHYEDSQDNILIIFTLIILAVSFTVNIFAFIFLFKFIRDKINNRHNEVQLA